MANSVTTCHTNDYVLVLRNEILPKKMYFPLRIKELGT